MRHPIAHGSPSPSPSPSLSLASPRRAARRARGPRGRGLAASRLVVAFTLSFTVLLVTFVLSLRPRAAHAGRDPFHDVRSLNARLQALRDAHPTTTRLVPIATVHRGEVLALEVDASGRFAAETPALFLQGGVHGNEWISTEVVLRLAELVVEVGSPATDGLIYRFVPAVNLDGFAAGSRNVPKAGVAISPGAAIEPNAPAYDANRDFPVPGQPDRRSRPLVQALRDYTRTGNIVAVLDYHSAAECLLWPWAYTSAKQPPDVAELAAVTREMAASVGYCSGQVANVIPYKHQGTAADWYQHALKAPTILVELSAADEPGSQSVEQILLDQERPFWIFLAWLERQGKKPRPPAPVEDAAAGDDAIGLSAPSPPAPSCQSTTVTVGAEPLGYRATGQRCAGLREGPWRFTFLTGEPMREVTYVSGREHGPWRSLHRDGGTQDVGHYNAGTPDAFWQRYAPDGTLIEARGYSAGHRDGLLVRFTDNGLLFQVRWCSRGPCRTICKAPSAASGKDGCLSPSAARSSPSAAKKARSPARSPRR